MYAEMGGQVADHGVIKTATAEFVVNNVQKNKGGKYMHYGKIVSGQFNVGDAATVSVDTERRKAIMRAHSATHLLQKAE
jgi:alanyl-tRNA synthetase